MNFCISGSVYSYEPFQVRGCVAHLTHQFVLVEHVAVYHSHPGSKAPHHQDAVHPQQALVRLYGWQRGTEDEL